MRVWGIESQNKKVLVTGHWNKQNLKSSSKKFFPNLANNPNHLGIKQCIQICKYHTKKRGSRICRSCLRKSYGL